VVFEIIHVLLIFAKVFYVNKTKNALM